MSGLSGRWKFSNFRQVNLQGEDGITYPSVEHYYQAHKTDDISQRRECLTMTPGEVKKWGQTLQAVDWDSKKDEVMFNALKLRYFQDPHKWELKMAKEEELIEWNTWHDNYWGICTCSVCGKSGKNRLGQLLAAVKELIINKEAARRPKFW